VAKVFKVIFVECIFSGCGLQWQMAFTTGKIKEKRFYT